MEADDRQEYNQFEGLIQGLIDNQYGCSNDFFLPEIMEGLRNNLTNLNASGSLKSAGIGNKKDFQTHFFTKTDTTYPYTACAKVQYVHAMKSLAAGG